MTVDMPFSLSGSGSKTDEPEAERRLHGGWGSQHLLWHLWGCGQTAPVQNGNHPQRPEGTYQHMEYLSSKRIAVKSTCQCFNSLLNLQVSIGAHCHKQAVKTTQTVSISPPNINHIWDKLYMNLEWPRVVWFKSPELIDLLEADLFKSDFISCLKSNTYLVHGHATWVRTFRFCRSVLLIQISLAVMCLV